ncbi:MAG TPA: ester cyclase [bacterium]|nr:ester cyclase [bacterium]
MHRRDLLSGVSAGLGLALLPALTLPAPTAHAADDTGMQLLRVLLEGLNARDVTVFDRVYAAQGFVQHQAVGGPAGPADIRAAVKGYFGQRFAAFPDYQVRSDISFGCGDLVCANLIQSGTQRGNYLGVPATGKHVTFNSTDIWRVREGMFVEHWGAADLARLLRQLKG